jgi:hypothetical protein
MKMWEGSMLHHSYGSSSKRMKRRWRKGPLSCIGGAFQLAESETCNFSILGRVGVKGGEARRRRRT